MGPRHVADARVAINLLEGGRDRETASVSAPQARESPLHRPRSYHSGDDILEIKRDVNQVSHMMQSVSLPSKRLRRGARGSVRPGAVGEGREPADKADEQGDITMRDTDATEDVEVSAPQPAVTAAFTPQAVAAAEEWLKAIRAAQPAHSGAAAEPAAQKPVATAAHLQPQQFQQMRGNSGPRFSGADSGLGGSQGNPAAAPLNALLAAVAGGQGAQANMGNMRAAVPQSVPPAARSAATQPTPQQQQYANAVAAAAAAAGGLGTVQAQRLLAAAAAQQQQAQRPNKPLSASEVPLSAALETQAVLRRLSANGGIRSNPQIPASLPPQQPPQPAASLLQETTAAFAQLEKLFGPKVAASILAVHAPSLITKAPPQPPPQQPPPQHSQDAQSMALLRALMGGNLGNAPVQNLQNLQNIPQLSGLANYTSVMQGDAAAAAAQQNAAAALAQQNAAAAAAQQNAAAAAAAAAGGGGAPVNAVRTDLQAALIASIQSGRVPASVAAQLAAAHFPQGAHLGGGSPAGAATISGSSTPSKRKQSQLMSISSIDRERDRHPTESPMLAVGGGGGGCAPATPPSVNAGKGGVGKVGSSAALAALSGSANALPVKHEATGGDEAQGEGKVQKPSSTTEDELQAAELLISLKDLTAPGTGPGAATSAGAGRGSAPAVSSAAPAPAPASQKPEASAGQPWAPLSGVAEGSQDAAAKQQATAARRSTAGSPVAVQPQLQAAVSALHGGSAAPVAADGAAAAAANLTAVGNTTTKSTPNGVGGGSSGGGANGDLGSSIAKALLNQLLGGWKDANGNAADAADSSAAAAAATANGASASKPPDAADSSSAPVTVPGLPPGVSVMCKESEEAGRPALGDLGRGGSALPPGGALPGGLSVPSSVMPASLPLVLQSPQGAANAAANSTANNTVNAAQTMSLLRSLVAGGALDASALPGLTQQVSGSTGGVRAAAANALIGAAGGDYWKVDQSQLQSGANEGR